MFAQKKNDGRDQIDDLRVDTNGKDLKKTVGVEWIHVAQNKAEWRAFVHTVM